MTAKTALPAVPGALADVALCTGPEAAAAARDSVSSFLDGVRRTAAGKLKPGEAPYPQPVIRQPRCTRFKIADVRAWLIQRAEANTQDAARVVVLNATRASAAARSKRQVAAQAGA